MTDRDDHFPAATDPAPGPHRRTASDARAASDVPGADEAAGSALDGTDKTDRADREGSRLVELVEQRRAKAARHRERGIDPYPVGVRVPDRLADVRAALDAWAEGLREEGRIDEVAGRPGTEEVTVAGRVVARRGHGRGRLAFLDLREWNAEVQVIAERDRLGEDMTLVDDLDEGDWVAVRGVEEISRKGEPSVNARSVTLLAKGLRPLPDTWHGLKDVEVRYRQRELDLAVNPDARRVFDVRAQVVAALRAEYADRGYVEVETPVLLPQYGGAMARPFTTHMHALDSDLYLRIATELYLKRLVAGGMPRVFEIGRVFRNEGLSPRHNPEFTMLESYEAYADYTDMMALTRALVQRAAREAVGTTALTYGGRPLDLGGEWPRRTLLDLVRDATGEPTLSYRSDLDDVRGLCDAHDVHAEPAWGVGKLVLELYEKLVEHTLWDPVFVTDHPVEVSPLARRHRDDPDVTERFEPIVAGRELGNAFSELTDPDDQRARLEAQARARAAGDEEAMDVDEAFLRAMELGMPPMGGLGVGVDRLVMLLADVPAIRDVILFPTLKPER